MSTTTIGVTVFDKQVGEVLRPQINAIPFSQATASHVGAQKTSTRGPGFTLTLTRYDAHANLATVRAAIENSVGSVVTITDQHGNTYSGYGFLISQSRVVRTRKLSRALGYRSGVSYSYAPGVEIVCQMTFYAVPA